MLSQIDNTFNITYDKSARIYMLVDGDGVLIETFPAKQKGEAVRFAIGLFAPAIAAAATDIANTYPTLERVVWAGAELAINGAVHIRQRAHGDTCVAMCDSSDGMGRYAITLNDSEHGAFLSCNCESYALGSAPTYIADGVQRRVCKHMAAYTLVRRAN